MTMTGAARKCRQCGAVIGPAPFAHETGGDSYCCEGCYLEAIERRARKTHDEALLDGVTHALAAALDAREHETGQHSKRVACHTLVLARRFSSDADELRQIYWGALLHDVGKIGIPDAILMKQGALSNGEWQVMRRHPEIGHGILAAVPALGQAAEIVLTHEERFDGGGYPHGLAGEAIPLWSRLFAVIDALDAMTSDRPYRKAVSYDRAQTELVALAGTQFDPVAIGALRAEETTLRAMVSVKCGEPLIPQRLKGELK